MAKAAKTPDDVIKESGHRLHARVVRVLREKNWYALISAHYTDSFTDKPREIDIVAEIDQEYHDRQGFRKRVTVRLFLECKYFANDTTTVFWFDERDRHRAHKRAANDLRWDAKAFSCATPWHHYLAAESVAKLFHSSSGAETVSKAVNQCLNAMVYHRGDVVPPGSTKRPDQVLLLRYPVIVCNSLETLHRTRLGDDEEAHEPIRDRFQLEVNYAYLPADGTPSRNEYFLIDVTDVDHLPELLDTILSKDVKLLRKRSDQ